MRLYRANRRTHRLMHADRMCAMLILPDLPHFSEATSNVSQPSEGAGEAAADAQRPPQRQNAGGICCRGRDKQESSSSERSRAWQVHARAGPYGASAGLRGLRLGWGFSQYPNRADVKI